MRPVILDEQLRSKLNGMNEVLPVCEPDGRTVGWYVPEEIYQRILYDRVREAVSAVELDAASREPLGRKLSDIIRDRMGGE